jgi:hypothetical protein
MKTELMRRWAAVAAGVVLLCAIPAIASAVPASVPKLTAGQLRGRILASARLSYAGYAESDATFGLPSLPGLADVTSLLDGVTKMRIWQASPERWRVDVLSDTGERDTYQLGSRSYIWDSGEELLTEVVGQPSLRLPRAADVTPPALAIRLLDEAGQHARFSVIAPQRVAGNGAAGLQMTSDDPASTIARIDIWAEPGNGLPLMVEIFGRGSSVPALETQFFQVGSWRPDAAVLTPQRGPGTGFTVTSADSLSGALNNLVPVALPSQLEGRAELPVPRGFNPIGVYGGGLATFVVLGLRGSADGNLLGDALTAGGAPLQMPGGTGVLISAPLINAVVVQPSDPDIVFLLAGTVDSSLLERAAGTLLAELGT